MTNLSKIISTLLLTLLVSCSSAPKLKYLNFKNEITLKYVLNYPSFSGLPKSEAKQKRKIFMEAAIKQIYASIFRLGYYGKSNFNPDNFGLGRDSIYYGRIPFRYTNNTPPVLTYHYENYRGDNYGHIEEKSSSYGIHDWSYPLAESEEGYYIVSPERIQKKISNNILVIKKKELTNALNRFYKNHDIINSKNVLKEFLRSHAHKFVNYRTPIRSLYKQIFTKYKMLQSGAGLSDETTNMPNSINFSIEKEINRQLIWGLMFVLDSKISAKRVNKKQLNIVIEIPFDQIIKKYNIKPLSKYIED